MCQPTDFALQLLAYLHHHPVPIVPLRLAGWSNQLVHLLSLAQLVSSMLFGSATIVYYWHQCTYAVQEEGSSVAIKPKSMANSISKTTGFGKDPTTSTAFLPDKERELQEQQLREQLKQEYELRQQVCMNIPEAQWVSLGGVYVLCY